MPFKVLDPYEIRTRTLNIPIGAFPRMPVLAIFRQVGMPVVMQVQEEEAFAQLKSKDWLLIVCAASSPRRRASGLGEN